ncbi:hypothetical protein HDK90DRAFT_335186 [Phyllosticta capitalensis]|uniref:Uncharacterized protein n=1 Tax=Phyllosticta capitalensis TaxID=121624 RepID=A0ABR1YIY3_9PEZI
MTPPRHPDTKTPTPTPTPTTPTSTSTPQTQQPPPKLKKKKKNKIPPPPPHPPSPPLPTLPLTLTLPLHHTRSKRHRARNRPAACEDDCLLRPVGRSVRLQETKGRRSRLCAVLAGRTQVGGVREREGEGEAAEIGGMGVVERMDTHRQDSRTGQDKERELSRDRTCNSIHSQRLLQQYRRHAYCINSLHPSHPIINSYCTPYLRKESHLFRDYRVSKRHGKKQKDNPKAKAKTILTLNNTPSRLP